MALGNVKKEGKTTFEQADPMADRYDRRLLVGLLKDLNSYSDQYVTEAPKDGRIYGRLMADWQPLELDEDSGLIQTTATLPLAQPTSNATYESPFVLPKPGPLETQEDANQYFNSAFGVIDKSIDRPAD